MSASAAFDRSIHGFLEVSTPQVYDEIGSGIGGPKGPQLGARSAVTGRDEATLGQAPKHEPLDLYVKQPIKNWLVSFNAITVRHRF